MPSSYSAARSAPVLDAGVESVDAAWRALGAMTATSSERSVLWVAVALPGWASDGPVARRMRRAGFAPMPGHPWLLSCRSRTSPRPMMVTLDALEQELEGSRIAVFSSEAEPTVADLLAELEAPRRAVARLRAQWLVPLMTPPKLTCRFQPIFALNGDVIGEEAFARATLGDALVSAALVLGAARDLDLLPFVDRLLRHEAVTAFRGYGSSEPKLFLNFELEAGRDPATFAQSQVEHARTHAIEPSRIVYEATHAELADPASLGPTLEALREAGFGIALDGLGCGGSGPELVRAHRPDYAKIDGRTARAAGSVGFAAKLVRRIAEAAREVGATTIATGIETTEQLGATTRAGVDAVQGLLLAPVRELTRDLDAA